MPNTVVETTRYANKSQFYLRAALVAGEVTRSQFKADLFPGKTMNFPYQSSVVIDDYVYSTDGPVETVVQTSDTYSIDQIKVARTNFDPLQNLTGYDINPEDQMSEEMGYQMANTIDQFTIETGLNGAYSTIAGGTLVGSNIWPVLTETNAALSRSRALQGVGRFLIMDPTRISYLAQYDAATGFNRADSALKNGYVGDTSSGFRVYESLNLPFATTLTLDTQPTAGDTFTLQGKVWTFVALGTATLPGDISLGANLAATQPIVVDAINGTGTPGASTYIDFDKLDRQELEQAQVLAGAFAVNITVINGYGELQADGTFFTVTNTFGTTTGSILAGCKGAIDLTVQSAPRIDVRYPVANVSFNLIGTTQYGAGVYRNFARSLAKITFNA